MGQWDHPRGSRHHVWDRPGAACSGTWERPCSSISSISQDQVLGQVLEPDEDHMPGKCPSFDQSLQ